MTGPLSESLNYCYSLMFTANKHSEKGCFIKAMLCYENCRKVSYENLAESSVYSHCYMRSVRKEAQLLINLGLNRRAYLTLRDALKNVSEGFHSMDKFLVLAQLSDLSVTYAKHRIEEYNSLMQLELLKLNE
ncbi:MAG: hypothetical protein MK132_14205 [Lentisphaerales bacterium]|nr:hypothetical protein [Lentisphaerales bacterium]